MEETTIRACNPKLTKRGWLAAPNPYHARAAASELLVAADLLQRGWYAFRPVLHWGRCDVVAIQGDLFRRIEVKSASASWKFAPLHPDHSRFDVLALVSPTGQIKYMPDYEVWEKEEWTLDPSLFPLKRSAN